MIGGGVARGARPCRWVVGGVEGRLHLDGIDIAPGIAPGLEPVALAGLVSGDEPGPRVDAVGRYIDDLWLGLRDDQVAGAGALPRAHVVEPV